MGLLRPIARKHLTMPRAIRTGTAALEGAKAIVLQRVDSRGGRVKIGGEDWTARSYMPDEVLDVGTEVEVVQIQGATALRLRERGGVNRMCPMIALIVVAVIVSSPWRGRSASSRRRGPASSSASAATRAP